ncbi:uncharacterized protein LOC134855466 [Symsagittifera roscoffensis]|uniref:uncharacterized protein LOC134855466 n=1 Tax=Symsagittifera roscoffensis TaxID=84072 RepID=UPI00307BD63D
MKNCVFPLAESESMRSKMGVHLILLALMISRCSSGSHGSSEWDDNEDYTNWTGIAFECQSSSVFVCEPVQACFDNRDCQVNGQSSQFCCGSVCIGLSKQHCQQQQFPFLIPLTAVIGTLLLVLTVYIVIRWNTKRLCHADVEQLNLHSRVVGFVRNVTSADDINPRNLQPASVMGMTLNVNEFRRQETQPTSQPQPGEDDEFKPRLPKYSLNRDEVIPEANYVMRYAEPPNSRRTSESTTHEPDEPPPAYSIPGTPERRESNQQDDTGAPPDYESSIRTISNTQIDDSAVYQYAIPPLP